VSERTKITLDESEIPRQWYNVIPDLPAPPPPPLHPGRCSRWAAGPGPLFPMELIRQEVATDSYIDIPADVLDVYRLWRPTPLYARTGWKRRWAPRRTSTTSTKGLPGRLAQAEHRGPAGVLQRRRGH